MLQALMSEFADTNGGHSPAQKLFGRPFREQDARNWKRPAPERRRRPDAERLDDDQSRITALDGHG